MAWAVFATVAYSGAAATVGRNSEWASFGSLMDAAVKTTPTNSLIQSNYAGVLISRGDYPAVGPLPL
jgi:hypothetical protein